MDEMQDKYKVFSYILKKFIKNWQIKKCLV